MSVAVIALVLLAGIAAGGLVAVLMLRRAQTRLRRLEAVAREIGAGRRARASELPLDDLGRLGREVNSMAEELRRRVQDLERERDERERILMHMSDGVALVDGAGRAVRINAALSEILGLPLPRPVDATLADLVRSTELDDLVARARGEGRPVSSELRLWAPRQRLVHATATPLGADDDAVLLVVHDLTEQERLNRVRQDFVANVSHELRTPLTSLRGYADTLLEGGLEDIERRREFVGVIRDQAVRLNDLIQDLLSLAELERPGAGLRLAPIDLREVVRRVAGQMQRRAEAGGLELEVVPGPPLRIEGDEARLEQVIANLLDNAVKYTESGGVTVTLGADHDRAWCEVTDTGPGIPAEDQPRIFERFYRVDKARSREKGGTGLGLSIVKHILALHGGTISVKSRIGEGSVFRFELPRRSLQARAS